MLEGNGGWLQSDRNMKEKEEAESRGKREVASYLVDR